MAPHKENRVGPVTRLQDGSDHGETPLHGRASLTSGGHMRKTAAVCAATAVATIKPKSLRPVGGSEEQTAPRYQQLHYCGAADHNVSPPVTETETAGSETV